MMNPAVRVVNAFWLLLRYEAVPAFETQLEISSAVGGAPFTLQMREHVAFAIGHGDDGVGRNHDGAGDSLVDNGLDVHSRQLRLGDNRPEQQTGDERRWNAQSHGGSVHTRIAGVRL